MQEDAEKVDRTTSDETDQNRNSNVGSPTSESPSGDAASEERMMLGFRDRTKHFTFAWFTLIMSTSGIAHVLHVVPLKFPGLYAIGVIFMILGMTFFLGSCVMMGLRFYWYPATFRGAFLHPTESLFTAAFVLALASILINITEYGLDHGRAGSWLVRTSIVLYWFYIVLAFASSCGIYLTIWSTHSFTIASMTPIWIFPSYPLLLAGPFAGVVCSSSSSIQGTDRLSILMAGFVVQGIGFMVSVLIYAAYISRLMTEGLPQESTRPGMFVSVGPSAFTTSTLINVGYNFPSVVPQGFVVDDSDLVVQVTRIVSTYAGLWLYGLAVWFFFVSAFAHWTCVGGRQHLSFALSWYGFVFPNTALTAATFNVAKVLGHNFALEVIGCIMTCALIFVWLIVLTFNVRAVYLGQVAWPQKDEDRDEHLFERQEASRRRRHGEHAGLRERLRR